MPIGASSGSTPAGRARTGRPPDGTVRPGSSLPIRTDRLELRLITAIEVRAVLDGHRDADWAPDFPSTGDLEIAGLLARVGIATGESAAFGHRLIVERRPTNGVVVGGIGFFGAPSLDYPSIELGYGLAPSRRGRGYATEAARAMVAFAFSRSPIRSVFATTDPDNVASQRVLARAGFERDGEDADGLPLFRRMRGPGDAI